jgi:peptide deformylase
MAKLKIYTFPDIVLSQKAMPVERVEKTVQKLAEDMLETMYDAPGIGLAANQVGVLKRLLVLDTDYEHSEEEGPIRNKNPIIIINPEIILAEGKIKMEEACLSCPQYSAEVERAEKIKLQYQDIDGITKTLMADGLQAVAIQHEIDHLNGRLFIERLSPIKTQLAKKRLLKERELREKNGAG